MFRPGSASRRGKPPATESSEGPNAARPPRLGGGGLRRTRARLAHQTAPLGRSTGKDHELEITLEVPRSSQLARFSDTAGYLGKLALDLQ